MLPVALTLTILVPPGAFEVEKFKNFCAIYNIHYLPGNTKKKMNLEMLKNTIMRVNFVLRIRSKLHFYFAGSGQKNNRSIFLVKMSQQFCQIKLN